MHDGLSTQDVGAISFLRPEDGVWFYEHYMGKGPFRSADAVLLFVLFWLFLSPTSVSQGIPTLMQPSELPEFNPAAMDKWANDSYLEEALQELLLATTAPANPRITFAAFAADYLKSQSRLVLRTPLPPELASDLQVCGYDCGCDFFCGLWAVVVVLCRFTLWFF
jgi:hypothetical protein